MLGELRSAIEGLDLLPDADALAEALALADMLAAKLSAAVAEFDAESLWELDGEPPRRRGCATGRA